MATAAQIVDAIVPVLKQLVHTPEEMTAELIKAGDNSSLRVSVLHTDIGKLIGLQGRTARSLRIIMMAMGAAFR